jgi:hypothetical protein
MLQPVFKTLKQLADKIDAYFISIGGEDGPAKKTKRQDNKKQKVLNKDDAGPATVTGLALFLGFNSRQAFEDYEQNGSFADALKRGRLRVECLYEKRLHQPAPTGAIFVLKSLGWNDKPKNKTADSNVFESIKVEMIETGPKPAENEQEVLL